MNKCTNDYSWLCKDDSAGDVLSSAETIQFSKIGSNPYLTAEYDVGLNKEMLTMEIYSLNPGAIRRECWGNANFEKSQLMTEWNSIMTLKGKGDIHQRFYSNIGSCRLIGYYKAKHTGEANIKILANSTSSAWIFNDTVEPNLPTLPISTYWEGSAQTIQDKLYYLRIDSVYYYKTERIGVSKFIISYANLGYSFSMSDMYYPLKTDYSPLNLSTLECNNDYFLPIPETNGSFRCPETHPECKKINYTARVADTSFNPYCEDYRWENNIQICETCMLNSIIYDNVCICGYDYWESYTTLQCNNLGRVGYKVYLYKVIFIQERADQTRKLFMLIISNPCIISEVWTCESTNESNLLMSSIFQPLILFGNAYENWGSLYEQGRYSYQINILNSSKLNLACWNETDFRGRVVFNQPLIFSNSFEYDPSYRSCRWEGFIRNLTAGDISFIISGTSSAKLWIKNDRYPVISYICCTPQSHSMRITKEPYYYFRLDISDPLPLSLQLKYRTLPDGLEVEIPAASMFQPQRMSLGVLTGVYDSFYTVSKNVREDSIYFCPIICTGCEFRPNGTKCTSCVDGAEVMEKGCTCVETKYWNDFSNKCEQCPPLCKRCSKSDSSLICSSCVLNSILDGFICECKSGYYEDNITNTCKPSTCQIEIVLNKVVLYAFNDTILETYAPCKALYGLYCEEVSVSSSIVTTRRQRSFTHNPAYLSTLYHISPDSTYNISILNLRSGCFLLETYDSPNWTGTPKIEPTPLDISIPYITSGKSFRLMGYIKFPETRVYNLRIESRGPGKMMIDYQMKYSDIDPDINLIFVGGRYYFFLIDFSGISSSPLTFKVKYRVNYESFNLDDDKIYYSDSNSTLRWNISSCDSMINTPSYWNGFRNCPLLCASCNIRIHRSTTESNELCGSCVENAKVNLQGVCECKDGFYSGYGFESCFKCPEGCLTCDIVNNVVECYTCIENGEVSLGECVCKSGYYFDNNQEPSCIKCPEICGTCSLSNGKVLCDSCIDNSHLEIDRCFCNTNYKASNSLPIYCYKITEYCTDTEEVNGIINCLSCVENAHIEGNTCSCNDGFYSSTLLDNICATCPDTCKTCREEKSRVVCITCIEMHYLSRISYESCLRCLDFCTKCKEIDGKIECTECFNSFNLELGRCTCDPEDYFLIEDTCITGPFTLNYDSKPNTINLYFSKRLYKALAPSDLDIIYPKELNQSSISYSIESIEGTYSYSLIFEYTEEIDQTFIIDIIFSDDVVDRQYQHPNITTTSVNLILIRHIEEALGNTCDMLCEVCVDDWCAKCGDYSYLDDIICKCYAGLDLDNICKPECPDGMMVDETYRTCKPCDQSCISTNSSETSSITGSQPENLDSEYSLEEIKEAELYSETSSSVSTASTSGSIFLGCLTFNLDNSWSLLNTVQIFSYLPFISVDMPLALSKALKSQDSENKIFTYLKQHIPKGSAPFQQAIDYGFNTGTFIYNAARPLLILMITSTINTIIYLIHRVSTGKIKELFSKILCFFYFGVYLRFFLQSYMELAVCTFIQILTVISIQPNSEDAFQIFSYLLNLLIFIFIILSPYFLAVFTYFNRKNLDQEAFLKVWGALFSDFSANKMKVNCMYYSLFLLRRLTITACYMILSEYPLIQISIISSSCWMVSYIQVFLFVLICRPFKLRAMNILQIYNEFGISVGYSLLFIFVIDLGLKDISKVWCVLSMVYFCYFIHISLILVNSYKVLKNKFIAWRLSRNRASAYTIDQNRDIKSTN